MSTHLEEEVCTHTQYVSTPEHGTDLVCHRQFTQFKQIQLKTEIAIFQIHVFPIRVSMEEVVIKYLTVTVVINVTLYQMPFTAAVHITPTTFKRRMWGLFVKNVSDFYPYGINLDH